MNGWKEYRLGEIADFQEGYVNPSQMKQEYFDGNIKWLRANDLNNSFVYNTSRTLTEIGFQSAGKSAKLFPPDSLAVSKSGTIGRLGILKDFMCGNRAVINIIPNNSMVSSRYLFYKLLHEHPSIVELAEGSVQKNLYIPNLKRLKVILPSLTIQTEIAEILSSLDDKIELNNQTNANLEALAQAIFKQWFIDFEFPDENGNPYKSSGGKMVESSQGFIPDGWSIHTVEQITKKVGMGPFGANIKVETFVETGIPIISGQHLKETLVLDNNFNYITPHHAQTLKNSIVQSGDVIFTHAGNIGQVAFLHSTAKHTEYIISQRQFYLRPDEKIASGLFFTLYFKSPTGQHKLLANASSTGVPSISRPVSYLRSIEMIVPKIDLMQSFDRAIKSIYDSVAAGRQEIIFLSNLRDQLLPRLLSGQISIE